MLNYYYRTTDSAKIVFKTLQSQLTDQLPALTDMLKTSSPFQSNGGNCTFVFYDDDDDRVDSDLSKFESDDEPMIVIEHLCSANRKVMRRIQMVNPKIVSRLYSGIDIHTDVAATITVDIKYDSLKKIPDDKNEK